MQVILIIEKIGRAGIFLCFAFFAYFHDEGFKKCAFCMIQMPWMDFVMNIDMLAIWKAFKVHQGMIIYWEKPKTVQQGENPEKF